MSPERSGPSALAGATEATDIASRYDPPITDRPFAPRGAAPLLHQYQIDILSSVEKAIDEGHRALLIPLATGAGKTVVAVHCIADHVHRGHRVLFLAHRRELILQASRKLFDLGIDHGILLPRYRPRLSEPVQVASIATLNARAIRTSGVDMPAADLVVIDEAHHVRARTYRRILEAYPNAVIIGLTATPCRSDGRGLGNVFDIMIKCPSVAELVAGGFLVSARIYAPTRPDLSGVRMARGDFVESDLAGRMDKPELIGDVVVHYLKLGHRRRAVVFATGVAHSRHLCEEFRRAGILAEHIDGSTPAEDRDAILARLAAGGVDVLCNAMVLTEGWDSPDVSCLILARPTRSLGLYRQMAGRILRPAPGKTDALILDHAGAVFAHGFPDDPIEWTLREDRRAENQAHSARCGSKSRSPALATCPECKSVRFEGHPCGSCGWRPRPKTESIDFADGELGRVDRDRSVGMANHTADAKAQFFSELLYIAQERGYQRGWAAHIFREKLGEWPATHFVHPNPPDDSTRAYVRSRQIAWAKAQQKRNAA